MVCGLRKLFFSVGPNSLDSENDPHSERLKQSLNRADSRSRAAAQEERNSLWRHPSSARELRLCHAQVEHGESHVVDPLSVEQFGHDASALRIARSLRLTRIAALSGSSLVVTTNTRLPRRS